MKTIKITVEQIDKLLPQTQCGLCNYDGCKPYAEAIVHQHEKINLCPPGGVTGLEKLAAVTQQDASPFIEEMKATQKPIMVASIREAECIGCVKCIKACPVDAIIGSTKLMHTVIADECSGCELCIEPCPVDCIDMIEVSSLEALTDKQFNQRAALYRRRYEFRLERLDKENQTGRKKHKKAKLANIASKEESLEKRKQLIVDAIARAKAKRP